MKHIFCISKWQEIFPLFWHFYYCSKLRLQVWFFHPKQQLLDLHPLLKNLKAEFAKELEWKRYRTYISQVIIDNVRSLNKKMEDSQISPGSMWSENMVVFSYRSMTSSRYSWFQGCICWISHHMHVLKQDSMSGVMFFKYLSAFNTIWTTPIKLKNAILSHAVGL